MRMPCASAATTRSCILALQFSDAPIPFLPPPPFPAPPAPSPLPLPLRRTDPQDRAVVVHQSRAWSDAGSRGFELTLDRGRVFFGLIHFWPGNAIAVRSRLLLPLNAWS